MTTQAAKHITADEFFAMSFEGCAELLDGEIIQMSPSGSEHGTVALNVGALVRQFVRQHRLGVVFAAETGFKLAPNRVRAPDVAFVSASRMKGGVPRGFFEGAPDLAVEVVSPSDRWPEVIKKAEEWLAAGASACWVVDPATRLVMVHQRDGRVLRFPANSHLTDTSVLPGLTIAVEEIFALE